GVCSWDPILQIPPPPWYAELFNSAKPTERHSYGCALFYTADHSVVACMSVLVCRQSLSADSRLRPATCGLKRSRKRRYTGFRNSTTHLTTRANGSHCQAENSADLSRWIAASEPWNRSRNQDPTWPRPVFWDQAAGGRSYASGSG